jgi:hypothetical protein
MTTTTKPSSWRNTLALSAVALGLAVIGFENSNVYADDVAAGKEAYSISELTQKVSANLKETDEGCSVAGGMAASGSACVTEAIPVVSLPVRGTFTGVNEKYLNDSDAGCSNAGGMGASGSSCVTEAISEARQPILRTLTSFEVKAPKSSASIK